MSKTKALTISLLVCSACGSPRVKEQPRGRADLASRGLAIGVVNNGDGVPAAAPFVRLDFDEASEGDDLKVVSVPVGDDDITVDGAIGDSEWDGVPSVEVSLSVATELLSEDTANPKDVVSIDYGVDTVRVWSAYDADQIFFRFEWVDATQSDIRGQWTYTSTIDGWQRYQGAMTGTLDPTIDDPVLRGRPSDRYEDRLYVMISDQLEVFEATNGCEGQCHFGEEDEPEIIEVESIKRLVDGGEMRTNSPGEHADLWHWTATRSNGLQRAKDSSIGCGEVDTTGQCSGDGIEDDGDENIEFRIDAMDEPCHRKKGDPARHPNQATNAYIGNNEYFEVVDGECVSRGPSRVPATDARFMYEPGSASQHASGADAVMVEDAPAPRVGDVAPGYIHRSIGEEDCDTCDVRTRARWVDGRWVLEISRTLAPPHEGDVSFIR